MMPETNMNVPRNRSSPVKNGYGPGETPEADVSHGGFAISNPLSQMILQNMVAPPSREVDAVSADLLLCSPELPPVPLADEVYDRDRPAVNLKDTYLGRKEDVEGYQI